ncbi:MAG: hypothetical protein BWY25_03239 [Chloroflexi bacterium ADurb.Bin222]|nr:MAG: hypothetical protein BWY25_03239 [Chloroflexi bacterium ADurb.Bin222]
MPGRREFGRIAQQIEQDLSQANHISLDEGEPLGKVQIPHHRLRGFRTARHAVEDLFQKGTRLDGFRIQVERPDFSAGEVKQIVDDPIQMDTAVIDVPQILQQRIRQFGAVRTGGIECSLAITQNHVQWRAEFVAYVGEQACFKLIRLLCRFLSLHGLSIQLGVTHSDTQLPGQGL